MNKQVKDTLKELNKFAPDAVLTINIRVNELIQILARAKDTIEFLNSENQRLREKCRIKGNIIRYFVHKDGFGDNTAYFIVNEENEVSYVRKDGTRGEYMNGFNFVMRYFNEGIYIEISKEEAGRLIKK